MSQNPIATIELESGEKITLELYPDMAPNTVSNFIHLANSGYYDGLGFHRIIENFMIQGGCPEGTGTGGPGYSIKGEFASNGIQNTLSHAPGTISMARSASPNSAGSQFFIMHKAAPHLDGEYAAFGKVTEGMDVINKLAVVETNRMDKPVTPQNIKTIRVDTFGADYPAPEKM
ncbi:MAG: peptidylprolyl isomerase [Firmicutes bacterium]|nr:peptidylprolyl isomerase [Bacillota bacterium]